MGQERWDIVLRFLDGPMAAQGDETCRGPVVRIGSNPGPGGLKLTGYRGLDDRQAVITAYDGGFPPPDAPPSRIPTARSSFRVSSAGDRWKSS